MMKWSVGDFFGKITNFTENKLVDLGNFKILQKTYEQKYKNYKKHTTPESISFLAGGYSILRTCINLQKLDIYTKISW